MIGMNLKCHAVLRLVAQLSYGLLLIAGRTHGDVVVIANRTPEPVEFSARVDDAVSKTVKLAPGDSLPLFATTGVHVRTSAGDYAAPEQSLPPNTAYAFTPSVAGGAPTLQPVGLGESTSATWPAAGTASFELPEANVITVKIVVDDDEVRQRRAWEPVIRARIDKVSAALEAHCGMKLRVVAIEEWDSDDSQRDFFQTLGELEREVLPAPADVAIAFSSQYDIASGRVHLGGTRQPLHSHILVKERSRNVLEPERAELLAHELGHYLGATHSSEPKSVMRPVIGQGVQRVAGARLQYDAPNTLLMSLLAEELRQRGIKDVGALTPETRRRMQEIYAAINPTLPDDPAAAQYVQLMGAAGARPLIEDTAKILQQIVRVAQLKKKLVNEAKDQPAPTGDQLLELYVRQAALAAKQVRRENAVRAFILALGIAFDDSDSLRKLPLASAAIEAIEPEPRRAERHAAFADMPTLSMRGRDDLAKHFMVSAHLVALLGSEPARGAGVVKEVFDSNGGSGFSFADMTANRAGIAFAVAVLKERLTLDDVARTFTVETFMPSVEGLSEGLQQQELTERFGGMGDRRLQSELNRIEAAVSSLPVYQQVSPDAAK
ncbi:hypothetical protein I41_41960 [Lacipirellula limnantheis]|uniref:Matrixin n=2 Tax=Lacipirellula limnantheis TaxID=2528024 RepID=A0A517U2Z6_9BACT|nr:hypothetical protein I41_41960 [Lacipirellula limnantheis]